MGINKRKLMESIWLEYHSKLQVYLKQLFPGLADPEERVSEILLVIFDRLDSYNPDFAMSTWIYMTARHIQIDMMRKKSLETVHIDDYKLVDTESPENLFLIKESSASLNSAIRQLKAGDREITYLYYYADLKVREISRITGTAQGTVKYRLMRIREMLKESVIREESL